MVHTALQNQMHNACRKVSLQNDFQRSSKTLLFLVKKVCLLQAMQVS